MNLIELMWERIWVTQRVLDAEKKRADFKTRIDEIVNRERRDPVIECLKNYNGKCGTSGFLSGNEYQHRQHNRRD